MDEEANNDYCAERSARCLASSIFARLTFLAKLSALMRAGGALAGTPPWSSLSLQ